MIRIYSKNIIQWLVRLFALCGLAVLSTQCAKEVAPTGGPKDTIAPKVIGTKPENGSVRFSSRRIQLTFDEFVDLDGIDKNLLISPPLAARPTIWRRGKNILIQIPDSLLQPNRTYSLTFSKAIVDVNEKNVLPRYVYAFSTGETIDTLRVKGKIQNALDQKVHQNTCVMLYHSMDDSAPRRTLPDYVTRCLADGSFEITNIAQGSYRVFALRDTNRNFKFDMPNEWIGFLDNAVIPTAQRTSRTDTIRRDTIVARKLANGKVVKDTIRRDTIVTKSLTVFAPDTLFLPVFEEQSGNQYIDINVRERKEKIVFAFKRALYDDTLRIVPLDSSIMPERLFIEKNQTRDTIVCWLRDTVLRKNDTLKLLVSYKALDKDENLVWRTDTLKPRYETRKDKFKGRLLFKMGYSIKNNATLNLGEDLRIQTATPIFTFRPDSIVLEQVTDTSALQSTAGLFYTLDSAKNEIVESTVVPSPPTAPFSDGLDLQSIASYRMGRSKFAISFAQPVTSPVQITSLSQPDSLNWIVTELDAPSKSVLCWLKDKDYFKNNNSRIAVRFARGAKDTTVQIDLSKKQKGQAKLKKNKSLQARFVLSLPKKQEVGLVIDQQLLITASNPIAQFDPAKIEVITMPDSTRVPFTQAIARSPYSNRQLCLVAQWRKAKSYLVILKEGACVDIWGNATKATELEFKTESLHKCYIAKPAKARIARDSAKLTQFVVSSNWDEKKRYRLRVKRGAFVDLYGKQNDTSQLIFSIPGKDTYGSLTMMMQGVKDPSLVQLLSKDGKQVLKQVFITRDTGFVWQNLSPGEYPLRTIGDKNKNSQWDAGNFKHHRQPEKIFVSPKPAIVKANWESKQIWNLLEKPSPVADTTKKTELSPNKTKK